MLLHVLLIAYRRISLKSKHAEILSYFNLSCIIYNYPFHFTDLMASEEEYGEEKLSRDEQLEDLDSANSGTDDKSWAIVGWIMTVIGLISLCCVMAFFKRHFGR